jgi:O-antigen/teichoic acid export membrane protein
MSPPSSGPPPPDPARPAQGADAPIPSSSRILGFTGWNLFGLCAPMLVAFFSIPLFIRGLGAERFGALTLVWMLVGYFGILDLGMGRAMTKMTAEVLGKDRPEDLPRVFWTALWMMVALGLFGALAIVAGSGWLAERGLNVPDALRPEIRRAFLVVSLGLPFTIAVTGLVGVLESHQRFRLINLVRVPLGIATFAAPLAILPFTHRLDAVVAVLISVRILELLVFLACCLLLIPVLRTRLRWDPAMVRPLLTFGGWMTVSNVTLPLMIHVDRFVVGAARTLAEVAYYANPSEIVVKLLILPRAWVSALFPPMTMHLARNSPEADALFGRATKLLLLVLYPAVLGLYAVAPEFLGGWLGAEYALRGAAVLRLLCAGIFVYAMSYLPFSLLQSAGRPDLSARWHLFELPLFVALAWWATRRWGIHGMAIAWGLRGLMDVAVLFPLALRFVPAARSAVRRTAGMMALGLASLPAVGLVPSLLPRIPAAALAWAAFSLLAWFQLLDSAERHASAQFVARFLAKFFARRS